MQCIQVLKNLRIFKMTGDFDQKKLNKEMNKNRRKYLFILL